MIPEPLPGRGGQVGGVESITLDGQRYFFGFGYSSDLVLSPPIADSETMAEFASRNISQSDGSHDLDYWRQMVDEAVVGSEVAGEEGVRDFTSAALRQLVLDLKEARRANRPNPRIRIEPHFRYLVHAINGERALDPCESPVIDGLRPRQKFKRHVFDPLETSLSILNGEAPPPDGTRYDDLADALRLFFSRSVQAMHPSWQPLFMSLKDV